MIEIVKKNIKRELKSRDLSVNDLCAKMGKDRNYINRMTDQVKLNKIVQIAQAIECKTSDLLTDL